MKGRDPLEHNISPWLTKAMRWDMSRKLTPHKVEVSRWITSTPMVVATATTMEELASLMPSAAHKLMADGSILEVPLEELPKGDRVVVKPGEKIPADGHVVKGETSVHEAMITGESNPVAKGSGAEVIGGSIKRATDPKPRGL